MILTCTSCLTRYFADEATIGPTGRSVRCASCGHTWFAEASLTLEDTAQDRPQPLTRERVERMRRAAASDQTGPAPSAAARFRAQQAERMRQERMRAAAFAWAGTGAALAASAAGAVLFRQDVAELWPRSASAFAAVGLDVNVYGLELYDLTVERAYEGPTPVLLVSGEVRNIGRDGKQAPPIRITLRDTHSNELYQIVHAIGAAEIAPGQGAPFQIRLENPPVDAADLEAAFASYGEAERGAVMARPMNEHGAEAPLVDPESNTLELTSDQALPDGEAPPHALNSEPALRLDMSSAAEGHG